MYNTVEANVSFMNILAHLFRIIGLFILFMMSTYGWGAWMMRLIGFRGQITLRFVLYAIALGMGFLAHIVFLLGATKLLYPWVAWAVILLSVLVCGYEWLRNWGEYRDRLHKIHLSSKPTWFFFALLFLLLLNWLYPLPANAFIPPISNDEVAYHLAAPKIYIQNHAIVYIPFIAYSNWPLEIELLFLLSLLLGSEILAHLVTWVALLLISLALWEFGSRHFDTETGLVAAVIFASAPMVTSLAGTGLIELPLTLFALLACIAMLDWLDTGDHRQVWLSATMGGLAASVKLNGALIPLSLGLVLLFTGLIKKRGTWSENLSRFSIYGLVSLLIVFPWYLKTWIFTGNPFWPFFMEYLGARDWDALGSSNLFGFISDELLPVNFWGWLSGLWKLTTDPSRYGPANHGLGWSYLILLPLSIPMLFLIKGEKRTLIRWLGLFSLLFYTTWFLHTHQARFLMPTTAIFALFAGSGFYGWKELAGQRLKWLLQVGLLAFLLASHCLMNSENRALLMSNLPYLTGRVDRESFLAERVPGYPVFSYANAKLPGEAYLWLALYEVRGYYLNRRYFWANPAGQRAIRLEEYPDGSQLADKLLSLGFTHVLLNTSTVYRYAFIPHGEHYAEITYELVRDHGELVYTSGICELYRLIP